ncbi:MAG: hypothetical protein KF708_18710 [Pirellulales bacterium]|nr:hypothetical protein [Pirellulales bacterium]
MSSLKAKYSSAHLSIERMRSALLQLPAIVKAIFGDISFTVQYGFGTRLHGALHFVPMNVSTEVLPWFLEDSLDQRIVEPGRSDLLIDFPNQELKLLYCHELDIHVDGSNDELIQRFIGCEEYRDIAFYSQAQLKAKYPDRA